MIQIGNDKIKEIYVGSDKIKEVYHGADLVWTGKKPSYAILRDGTRVDFELENTPIDNFCGTGDNKKSITVNGTSIVKNTIKELVFGSSYSRVTSINDNFLRSLINLDSLDLSSLNKITTVGSDFLSSTNLPSYDLNHLIPLNNVTTVGDYFLYDCLAVTSIDLSPLSKLTSIPNNFLQNCTKLTSADFSSLSNVTTIGTYFLRNCSALTQFKIGAVNVPTTIVTGFLYRTTALTSILVPMQSVQAYKTTSPWSNHAPKIQGYWKKPSYAILTDDTRIDFELESTPISNLEGAATSIILNGTSYQKTTIKEITFGSSYENVASIGDYFLLNCSSLTSLDLSAFSNVTSIGNYFLGGCSNLTSLDLSAFINLTSISTYFLTGCSNLTSLDLSAFSNVTSIGINFLRGCSSLTSLDLSAFNNVASIGYSFMYNCSNLTQFKIGAINVPQTETDWFLESTTALTTILVPMQSVQAYKTTSPWSSHASKIQGY